MRTILVVDDESHITYILSSQLKRAGFSAVTASNGEEGCLAATVHQPDLIITDFQMPRLSGLDMCMKLHQQPQTSHIPVIMLTARGHRLTEQELSLTSIRAVETKPFSIRDLLAKSNELLGVGAHAA